MRKSLIAHLLGVTACCAPAGAQEALFTESAAMPSRGRVMYRQTFHWAQYQSDPSPLDRDIAEVMSMSMFSYGLRSDLSLNLELPLMYRDARTDVPGADATDFALDDFPISLKYRFYQKDLGPIDTVRAAVWAGVEVPSGSTFSSDSVDPFIGVVTTVIEGRNGLNLALTYKWNTTDDVEQVHAASNRWDAVMADVAYLYRLAPAQFGTGKNTGYYAVLELNGVYETNGDYDVMISPGFLIEATDYAFEIGARFPLFGDVDRRPEEQFMLMIGLRLLF